MEKKDYADAKKKAKILIGVDVSSDADLFALQNACNYLASTEHIKTAA